MSKDYPVFTSQLEANRYYGLSARAVGFTPEQIEMINAFFGVDISHAAGIAEQSDADKKIVRSFEEIVIRDLEDVESENFNPLLARKLREGKNDP